MFLNITPKGKDKSFVENSENVIWVQNLHMETWMGVEKLNWHSFMNHSWFRKRAFINMKPSTRCSQQSQVSPHLVFFQCLSSENGTGSLWLELCNLIVALIEQYLNNKGKKIQAHTWSKPVSS